MLDDSSNRLIWIAVGLALIFGIFETYNGTIPKILESVTSTTQASIPVEHTAYAYSADGTDGFTTTYPNLNLLNGTSKTARTTTISKDTNFRTIYPSAIQFSEKNIRGSVYLDLTNCPYDVWFQLWTKNGTLYGNTVKAGQKGYSRFSGKVPIITDNNSNIAFRTPTNVTDTITFDYYEMKIEEGSIATSWMPSASEVKDSDYPTYIGTYTDHSQSTSNDPTKYTWKKRD